MPLCSPPACPFSLGLQAGWSVKNMAFVAGGLQQWRYDGLPLE
jgi:hypothetical protein